MTIRHLRIFITVAETLNMHVAAKQLYIAQPAISQAISELERHYSVRLFERLSKKIYITPTGSRFLFYAKHILSLFGELEQQMNDITAYTEIKIGATITIGTCLMNYILKEFQSCYPQAEVRVSINSPDYLGPSLSRNELDLALVESLPTSPDLIFEPFLEDEMILVVSPDHKFAKTGYATLDEISKEPYIAREPSSTPELFHNFMEIHNQVLKNTWFCNNSETTKLAVIHNYGITVISRRIVEQELQNGSLTEVALEGGPLLRKFYMVYHKNKFFTNALLDLKEICKDLEVSLPPGSVPAQQDANTSCDI